MKRFLCVLGAIVLSVSAVVHADPAPHRPGRPDHPPRRDNCARQDKGGLICENDTVMLPDNREIGQVIRLLGRDRAQVRVSSGFFSGQVLSYDVDSLSAEDENGIRSIRAGVTVLVRSGNPTVGVVLNVFSNGKARVQLSEGIYNGQVSIHNANDLVAAVSPCFRGFCENDEVINRNNSSQIGLIKQFFENGMARVMLTEGLFARQTFMIDSNELSRSVTCLDRSGVCVNKMVSLRSNPNMSGQIVTVYDCGLIKVKLTNGLFAGQERIYNASELLLSAPGPGRDDDHRRPDPRHDDHRRPDPRHDDNRRPGDRR